MKLVEIKAKSKVLDFVIIILLPVFATSISLSFELNFLLSTILFFIPISIYLSIRDHTLIKNTLLFAAAYGIPVGIIIDFLGFKANMWEVSSLLRLYGGAIAIESIIFSFVSFFSGIIIWRYFFRREKECVATKLFYVIAILLLPITGLTLIIDVMAPEIFIISFPYLKFVIFLYGIPLIILFLYLRDVIKDIVLLGIYMFFLNIQVEYVGVVLHQWAFPGRDYLAVVNFFGHILPYEEILWWFLSAIPAIVVYEFTMTKRLENRKTKGISE